MLVAFLEDISLGEVLMTPKHPHITVKKKFKPTSLDENTLVELLRKCQAPTFCNTLA